MPKMIRVEKTTIDKIAALSADLPAKEPSDYPLKESIQQLLPVIENLQKKGYSIEEISKLYTNNGLTIGTTTLRQYLQDFSKKLGAKKPKKALPPTATVTDKSPTEAPTEAAPTEESTEAPVPPPKREPAKSAPEPAQKSTFNTSDLNNL
jgi:hypothetical protein